MNHQKIKNITLDDISIINDKCVIKNSICQNTPGIFLIHAEWCGHCKRFLPTYEKISEMLNKEHVLNVPLVALESEELKDNDKVEKLNFRGFPTIKFFDQNGVVMDDEYKGDRGIYYILQELCDRYHKCYQQ
jgi:thiol-disulfide isomerase/thioredoxin